MSAPHTITTETAPGRVRAAFAGETVADSTKAVVLRESGLPPVFYFPPDDVRADLLSATDLHTRCPFKGEASYWSADIGDVAHDGIAWEYELPIAAVAELVGYVSFYPNRVDVTVNGEPLTA